MKKLFVYMLVGAGFVASAAYADGYNPFHPLGGINSATTVPQAYSDGTTGTLAQMAQMADGSVQQTDANQINGYAKLDGNASVTSPVTGDTSKSSIVALSHNTPAVDSTLSQLIADNAYIHSLGASAVGADGSISPAKLGAIIGSASRPLSLRISSGESIPAGQSSTIALPATMSNSVMIRADGQLFNSSDEGSTNAGWNGGNLSRNIGEGALVEDFEPKFGLMRDREYNNSSSYDYSTYRMPASITSDFYTNNAQWVLPTQCQDSSNPDYNTWWCDIGSWKTSVHYNKISSSSNAGTNGDYTDFYSYGTGHWKSDDVGDWKRMHMFGTNWGWASIREMIEEGGISAGGYTDSSGNQQYPGFQRYIYEWDIAGVGNDLPSAYYNPVLSNRKGMWLHAYNAGGASWKASVAMPQYQILLVTNSSGTTYMYENTAANATTGTTQPAWAFNETAPITDGTASWVFLGAKRFEVGCALCIGGDTGDEYGAFLASNAYFYDSPIDLSMANYNTSIPAVMRTKAGSYFDLSADGSKSGQNNHLFGYGSYGGIGWNTLEYVVKGTAVWHMNDQGFIGAPVGVYTATGTSFNDAASSGTPIFEVSSASGDNAGIKAPVIGADEHFKLFNYSGHPIRLYPPTNGWSINNSSYRTINNGEWAEGYVSHGNNLNVHSSGQAGDFSISKSLYLGQMTKAAILAITSPVEGQTAYEMDDHQQVTWRCPASTACAWFPVQYGTALSN